MYDTTYEHETMNEHPSQERVVLHVDFFNTFALTPVEIEVNERNPKHFFLGFPATHCYLDHVAGDAVYLRASRGIHESRR